MILSNHWPTPDPPPQKHTHTHTHTHTRTHTHILLARCGKVLQTQNDQNGQL